MNATHLYFARTITEVYEENNRHIPARFFALMQTRQLIVVKQTLYES